MKRPPYRSEVHSPFRDSRKVSVARPSFSSMPMKHPYTREELSEAVRRSRSWRGVMRHLGRPEHSAGATKVVRREVVAFGIDHSHFTGQRRWSDTQLRDAIAASGAWAEVLERLGLSSGGNHATVRAHAARLGLDSSHFRNSRAPREQLPVEPQLANLRVAGPTLAAGWFMVRGYQVLWPLEPCRYDLAVRLNTQFQRVQVKTATLRNEGTYIASLSNSRRVGHVVYDVDEIDSFFVIDGELNAYLIPFADVGGFQTIYLRNYRAYVVGERGNWLENPSA